MSSVAAFEQVLGYISNTNSAPLRDSSQRRSSSVSSASSSSSSSFVCSASSTSAYSAASFSLTRLTPSWVSMGSVKLEDDNNSTIVAAGVRQKTMSINMNNSRSSNDRQNSSHSDSSTNDSSSNNRKHDNKRMIAKASDTKHDTQTGEQSYLLSSASSSGAENGMTSPSTSNGGINRSSLNATRKKTKGTMTKSGHVAGTNGKRLHGIVFFASDAVMHEAERRMLFGLKEEHLPIVSMVRPGTPIFLYNSTTRKLFGGFEAASRGRKYIEPKAWTTKESTKCPYPAQVRVRRVRVCPPLEPEDYTSVLKPSSTSSKSTKKDDLPFDICLSNAQVEELQRRFGMLPSVVSASSMNGSLGNHASADGGEEMGAETLQREYGSSSDVSDAGSTSSGSGSSSSSIGSSEASSCWASVVKISSAQNLLDGPLTGASLTTQDSDSNLNISTAKDHDDDGKNERSRSKSFNDSNSVTTIEEELNAARDAGVTDENLKSIDQDGSNEFPRTSSDDGASLPIVEELDVENINHENEPLVSQPQPLVSNNQPSMPVPRTQHPSPNDNMASPSEHQTSEMTKLMFKFLFDVDRFVANKSGGASMAEINALFSKTGAKDAYTGGDAFLACANIQQIVRSVYPNASVEMYGSLSTGLWLPGQSDLDLLVNFQRVRFSPPPAMMPPPPPPQPKIGEQQQDKPTETSTAEERMRYSYYSNWTRLTNQLLAGEIEIVEFSREEMLTHLAALCTALGSQPWCKNVKFITRIPVDISILTEEHMGIQARDFVSQLVAEFPLVIRPLTLVIKRMLRENNMHDVYTGGLGSYSLTLLIVFFLQRCGFNLNVTAMGDAARFYRTKRTPIFPFAAAQPMVLSPPSPSTSHISPPPIPTPTVPPPPATVQAPQNTQQHIPHGNLSATQPQPSPIAGNGNDHLQPPIVPPTAAAPAATPHPPQIFPQPPMGQPPQTRQPLAQAQAGGYPATPGAFVPMHPPTMMMPPMMPRPPRPPTIDPFNIKSVLPPEFTAENQPYEEIPQILVQAEKSIEEATCEVREMYKKGVTTPGGLPDIGLLLLGFLKLYSPPKAGGLDLGVIGLSLDQQGSIFLHKQPASLCIRDPVSPDRFVGSGSFAMQNVQAMFENIRNRLVASYTCLPEILNWNIPISPLPTNPINVGGALKSTSVSLNGEIIHRPEHQDNLAPPAELKTEREKNQIKPKNDEHPRDVVPRSAAKENEQEGENDSETVDTGHQTKLQNIELPKALGIKIPEPGLTPISASDVNRPISPSSLPASFPSSPSARSSTGSISSLPPLPQQQSQGSAHPLTKSTTLSASSTMKSKVESLKVAEEEANSWAQVAMRSVQNSPRPPALAISPKDVTRTVNIPSPSPKGKGGRKHAKHANAASGSAGPNGNSNGGGGNGHNHRRKNGLSKTPRNGNSGGKPSSASGSGHKSSTLFVGNLDYSANELDLENLKRDFAKFGSIVDVEVSMQRGALWVTFRTPEQATSALEKMNKQQFLRRPLYVDYSQQRRKNSGKRKGNNPQQASSAPSSPAASSSVKSAAMEDK